MKLQGWDAAQQSPQPHSPSPSPVLASVQRCIVGPGSPWAEVGPVPSDALVRSLQIAKEDAVLPVALFPSLCELIFHNNPLVAHTRGMAPTDLCPRPSPPEAMWASSPLSRHAKPCSALCQGWTRFIVHCGLEKRTDATKHPLCTKSS